MLDTDPTSSPSLPIRTNNLTNKVKLEPISGNCCILEFTVVHADDLKNYVVIWRRQLRQKRGIFWNKFH